MRAKSKNKNSNKNELKWVEENSIIEIMNVSNISGDGLLDFNELSIDDLLNLSLFKNSNVSNDNSEDNFSNLEGKLEHSPKFGGGPDSYYVDEDRKLIVGYEHFTVTSSCVARKGGAKTRISLSKIMGTEIPTYTKTLKVDMGYGLIKEFILRTGDKNSLKDSSPLPLWIEREMLSLLEFNLFEDEIISSKFNFISEDNLIESITEISQSHIKQHENYITNLKKLRKDYDIKFNFVIDMSDIVIPSIEVKQKYGDYTRTNYINYGGLQKIIKKIRDVFINMLELKVNGNNAGIIIIVPNAHSAYSIEGYTPFYVNSYLVYHFKDIKSIDKFIINEHDEYSKIYSKDEVNNFKQAMYSVFNKNLRNENSFKTSKDKIQQETILLKREENTIEH